MDYNLVDITNLRPLLGDTNKSYMGYLDDQKVFVKKDSSPFFVSVANEKLSPKLVWSKVINGSMWVAQEWIQGDVLKSCEISDYRKQIMTILNKLHNSDYLALILYRLEGKEMEPIDFLQEYYWQLPITLEKTPILSEVYNWLEDKLPYFEHFNICACHGDVNHKNFIFKNNLKDEVYLIDWDSAILSDHFCDIGSLLYRYVEIDDWKYWLQTYGLRYDDSNIHKIWWYGQVQHLMHIKSQYQKGRFQLVKQELELLKIMNQRKEQYYESQK